MALRILAHGKTDRGVLRSRNEDHLLLDEKHGIYAVADGVGGLPHGADASHEAIAAIERHVSRPPGPTGWFDLPLAFRNANTSVITLGERLFSPYSIGTTLTAIQVRGDSARFAHVGDSALFRFHNGWCDKLTRDHTVAEEQSGWGSYKASEARNVLTRCIGAPDAPEVDVGTVALAPGMWLLLCTDGLFRGVSPDEVKGLFTPEADPADVCARLIELVNSRGGPDNSTAIALRFDPAS
jgi:protein phosphatase